MSLLAAHTLDTHTHTYLHMCMCTRLVAIAGLDCLCLWDTQLVLSPCGVPKRFLLLTMSVLSMLCAVCLCAYVQTHRPSGFVKSLLYGMMDFPDGREFSKDELKVCAAHTVCACVATWNGSSGDVFCSTAIHILQH